MEIRTMEYYLAVVREGTISAAAESLHVAQPSLSRQMKELEDELHTTLFIRGNRKITLTEEGMILRKRAEEMVRLAQMTQEEIAQYVDDAVAFLCASVPGRVSREVSCPAACGTVLTGACCQSASSVLIGRSCMGGISSRTGAGLGCGCGNGLLTYT